MLEGGKVVEVGEPRTLMRDEGGKLSGLVGKWDGDM